MTAGTVAPGSFAGAASFELERFECTEPGRLEIAGRWFGVRGLRFIRPALDLRDEEGRHRLLALLDHKPWAAEDGEDWVAAFPWEGDATDGFVSAELTVGPSVAVELPCRGGSRKSSRGSARRASDGNGRPRASRIRATRSGVGGADGRATRGAEPRRNERDAAIAERDAAVAERDAAFAERDAAISERDRAVAARDSARAERDAARRERDAVLLERDELARDHEAARAARDAALSELEAVIRERDAAIVERGAAWRDAETAAAERDAAHAGCDALSGERQQMRAALAAARRQRDAALSQRDEARRERDELRSASARPIEPPPRATGASRPIDPSAPAGSVAGAAWKPRLVALGALAGLLAVFAAVIHGAV